MEDCGGNCSCCEHAKEEQEYMYGIHYMAKLYFGDKLGDGPDDLDCHNCCEHAAGKCKSEFKGSAVVDECLGKKMDEFVRSHDGVWGEDWSFADLLY